MCSLMISGLFNAFEKTLFCNFLSFCSVLAEIVRLVCADWGI